MIDGQFLLRSWRKANKRITFCILIGQRMVKVGFLLFPALVLGLFGWRSLVVEALKQCGGAFVKAGQWASTRPDVLPLEVCQELERLHSSAQAHSFAWSLLVVQRELPASLHLTIDKTPIGVGTVAQVHKAKLHNSGKPDVAVAIKILHPRIIETIQIDLAILKIFAVALEFAVPATRWINLPGEVDVFSQMMHAQCDLALEAEHLRTFNRNFSKWNWWKVLTKRSTITFPIPVYASQNLLVETLQEGIPIQTFIKDASVSERSKDRIARVLFRGLLKMILKDNFIHADLHPGNIMVDERENLILLDAGLVTKLGRKDHRNFIDLFRAIIFHQDGFEAGRLIVERSPAKDQQNVLDREGFYREIEEIVQRTMRPSSVIPDLILAKIAFSDVFKGLLRALKKHHVKLDENYTNIIMSILCIEGLGRQLSNGINLLPLLKDVGEIYLGRR